MINVLKILQLLLIQMRRNEMHNIDIRNCCSDLLTSLMNISENNIKDANSFGLF